MTSKSLKWRFVFVAMIYFVGLIGLVTIRLFDCTSDSIVYNTMKDVMPLVLALPVVWLGYGLQRRIAFVRQLLAVWSKLASAMSGVQFAIQHGQSDRLQDALVSLSAGIDEIRGVFCNLPLPGSRDGLYPFEPLKQIHALAQEQIDRIGNMSDAERQKLAHQIFLWWRDTRSALLKEFDRQPPTYSHSHFAEFLNNNKRWKVLEKQ